MGQSFSQKIIDWHRSFGRKNLPWQKTRDPYKRWVAEIMLQQTQVITVQEYYERFLKRFPTVLSLASSSLDDVLKNWAGLGYYARARNLHKASREIVKKRSGIFPNSIKEWIELPGVGLSTAGAILSAVTDRPHPILDGNVKRVLSRYFAIGKDTTESEVNKKLWAKAQEVLPPAQGETYAQGLMDLGATVCTKNNPKCSDCPLAPGCAAHLTHKISIYPTPRKNKKKDTREIQVLIIRRNNSVFLTRRIESGIWHGLWTPPLRENTRNIASVFSMNCELTHIKLRLVVTTATEDEVASLEGRWVKVGDLGEVGLPTPIKKILERFFDLTMKKNLRTGDEQ